MSFSQLRPLSFGEILDGSFTLYRRQFVSMFLTALIPQIPMVICWGLYGVVMTTMMGGDPTQMGPGSIGMLIAVAVLFLVAVPATVVAFGGVVFQVSRAYTGSPVGTREALRRGWQRVLPLTGSIIVVWLMMMVGLLFCVVPGLMVALASFAVMPAVVLERRGPIEAIDRSFQLIKGAWLEVFLVILVAYLITTLPGMAVGMLSLVGIIFTQGDPQATAGIQAGTQVLSALVRTITMPFSLGCTVLLYYDRRVRTEALDVQMMAESLNTAGGGQEYPAGTGYAGGSAYPGGAAYQGGQGYPGGTPYQGAPGNPGGPAYGQPGAPTGPQGARNPVYPSYGVPDSPADFGFTEADYGANSRFARPRETPAAPESADPAAATDPEGELGLRDTPREPGTPGDPAAG